LTELDRNWLMGGRFVIPNRQMVVLHQRTLLFEFRFLWLHQSADHSE